jgi:ectoine hydroxylase-related dioxygenase (phytanoyl-CoA dioxygenase family)
MNSTAVSPDIYISDQQKQQYQSEGYFILERAIPPAQLDLLRGECQRFIDVINAEMDAEGVTVKGINHRGKRYFIGNRHSESAKLREFLFGDLMAEVCRASVGPNAFLFVEQFVVKMAEVGMKFAWHQDSGYVGHAHTPYVSCWCALDDMTEANGTIYVLPYSRAGVRTTVKHTKEAGTNDMVGYHGDDPGIPVIVPAGSIAVFSSNLFHRSGANTTDRPRRSYLCQYSPEPILNKEGTKPWCAAVPFLRSGSNVFQSPIT